ncbi:MAG: phycobilisome rod-core linker polypeptide [Vicinamibacterales bacterium]
MGTVPFVAFTWLALPFAAQLIVAQATGQSRECEPNPARVVDDIYQQVLERSADQASAGMTRALAAGRMTVRDLVAQLAKSPEHAEQFFWKPAVTALYRRQLGREPDPEGLRSFTELARRDGLDAVERALLASPEFQRRGTTAGPSGSFAQEYEAAVRSLYRHLLGRDPDPAGLRDLTQIAQTRDFDAVVDRMLASREYQQLYGDHVVPGRGVRYCGPTP